MIRSPVLHFLLLGGLLFLSRGWLAADESAREALRISVDAEQIGEMKDQFTARMGRRPDQGDVERMILANADEEMLFREAVARGLLERDGGVKTRLIQKMLFLDGGAELDEAPLLLARAIELGLHHEDIVVRRILVQRMKLLGAALRPEQRVTENEIEARYAAAKDGLRAPDRLSLSHVFLSSDRRGDANATDATRLLGRLSREGLSANEARGLGDPFPLGHALESRSRQDLERSFGARFGEAVFSQTVGTWSQPIPSAYGLHLVHVNAFERGRIPPLETVRDRLRLEIEEERRSQNLAALLESLRTRYLVVVEDSMEPPTAGLPSAQEPG